MLYLDPVALGIQSEYRDEFEEARNATVSTEGYIWRSKDGRRTPVTKMSTAHIENCIKAINRGAIGFETKLRKKEALSCLQAELDE